MVYPTGEPIEITAGGGRNKRLTISGDGKKIAYGTLTINSNIWSVPTLPRSGGSGQPVPLTRDTSYRNPIRRFHQTGQRLRIS
jgi:hypothetical protein